MMKRSLALVAALLTAACSTNPHVMKFGGDGVYYASSPPVYTYVDFFGFPYYGPYSMAWYHPVWYSPISGCHYRWRCSGHYWGGYYGWYANRAAFYGMPIERRAGSGRADDPARASRPIPPVDLNQLVIDSGDSRYRLKQRSYRSPGAKRYPVANSPKGGYSSPGRSSGDRYGTSRTTSSGRTVRPPVVRRDSEDEY